MFDRECSAKFGEGNRKSRKEWKTLRIQKKKATVPATPAEGSGAGSEATKDPDTFLTMPSAPLNRSERSIEGIPERPLDPRLRNGIPISPPRAIGSRHAAIPASTQNIGSTYGVVDPHLTGKGFQEDTTTLEGGVQTTEHTPHGKVVPIRKVTHDPRLRNGVLISPPRAQELHYTAKPIEEVVPTVGGGFSNHGPAILEERPTSPAFADSRGSASPGAGHNNSTKFEASTNPDVKPGKM